MNLLETQFEFSQCLAKLIITAHEMGFNITMSRVYDENSVLPSGVKSCHAYRLAADLNLFRDGEFLTDTESHRVLGEFWKTLHPLASWGGDFKNNPDGNHYSFAWNGVR